MNIYICFGKNRNAMGDNFLGLASSIENKEKTVIVAPAAYDVTEFDEKFYAVINEEVYRTSNIYEKIKKVKDLIGIIKKYKEDKLNVFFMNQTIWGGIILCLVNFDRVVTWLHDPKAHFGSSIKERVIKFFVDQLYLSKADKIIVSYKGALKDLGRNIAKGIVVYLPRMIVQEFEDIRNEKIKTEYDFIFFGRIESYKGIDDLIGAFARLNKKLLIVGKGSIEDHVREVAIVNKNITFINDYISDRKLAEYIMRSKFVILPYKDATGTQTVQLANYYGKMVLATRVGCFAEYIEEGVNGIFIEENNVNGIYKAIQRVEKIKIEKMRKNIKCHMEMFEVKSIAKKIENVVGG